jgi:hypothetical protein
VFDLQHWKKGKSENTVHDIPKPDATIWRMEQYKF